MQGLCCCTFIGSCSHHLAPCFFLTHSRWQKFISVLSFHSATSVCLNSYSDIQKEMTLKLGKEEDGFSRSSFFLVKHDTFTSTSELPVLRLLLPHESFPVMVSLNTQTRERLAHHLFIIPYFWPASPLCWVYSKLSERCILNHKKPESLNLQGGLNYLQASKTWCVVVSAAAVLRAGRTGRGGDRNKQKRQLSSADLSTGPVVMTGLCRLQGGCNLSL